ncbi:heat-inducible transcriptional repressor HrcA [Paracoccus kondratievae]|uniref:Heat-inducible transcription repressor HrcA n=1 Tax=Paracoccus kondratievae TaxID=135740 RepID=A0AAD3P241_9RHOB|nr:MULTISPECIES: heat-inducible transcriptional repressor HrcA [Paracoccus]QFQ85970.1 heat-inducible transcriptional repressor HrcA [Paracoccus kondratievae]GLK66172.1 heat-inducible transcription repressor HrcA [Paracoccus kondratievae]SMG42608.1 heat-inducible transcription repressor HrcA [Paracoccus sp. J56]
MPETPLLSDLNDRSREVFRRVVEAYLATGEPVGSRTLTREMTEKVSAATIRNVMQDLELLGLLDHPHISAGRMPTQLGLRLFVDGLMEAGPVSSTDREMIEETLGDESGDTGAMLDRVSTALSALTQGASLVLMPKQEAPVRHIEFIGLAADRALVVLVFADGRVENRIFTPPPGHTASAMREAANFLNTVAEGRTLAELRRSVAQEIEASRRQLNSMAAELASSGLAMWDGENNDPRLIVRGRANLLAHEQADLDRVRRLFDDLERKRDIAEFLELAEQGEGVRIFIGSENKLFSLSGSSLVVSPYMNADRKIVGAVGVIGPTRLNYGRIVPIVDYTAQLVGRVISGRKG